MRFVAGPRDSRWSKSMFMTTRYSVKPFRGICIFPNYFFHRKANFDPFRVFLLFWPIPSVHIFFVIFFGLVRSVGSSTRKKLLICSYLMQRLALLFLVLTFEPWSPMNKILPIRQFVTPNVLFMPSLIYEDVLIYGLEEEWQRKVDPERCFAKVFLWIKPSPQLGVKNLSRQNFINIDG